MYHHTLYLKPGWLTPGQVFLSGPQMLTFIFLDMESGHTRSDNGWRVGEPESIFPVYIAAT